MGNTDKLPLKVVYGDFTLGVHGEGFHYIFSYAQGGLESIVKNGLEWLYRCPKPTFWRALTDNDRGSKFHIKSGSWYGGLFVDCFRYHFCRGGTRLFVRNAFHSA